MLLYSRTVIICCIVYRYSTKMSKNNVMLDIKLSLFNDIFCNMWLLTQSHVTLNLHHKILSRMSFSQLPLLSLSNTTVNCSSTSLLWDHQVLLNSLILFNSLVFIQYSILLQIGYWEAIFAALPRELHQSIMIHVCAAKFLGSLEVGDGHQRCARYFGTDHSREIYM